MTVHVPLYNRHREITCYATVDDEDGEAVLALRWHRDSVGYPARFHQRLHQFIAARMGILGLERNIDHRNGDPLDNRRSNLRAATQGQNMRNPVNRLQVNNRSGVRGVWWDKARGRWATQGTRDKVKVVLGRYNTLEEAAAVRAAWEQGEYQTVVGRPCPAGDEWVG